MPRAQTCPRILLGGAKREEIVEENVEANVEEGAEEGAEEDTEETRR